MVSSGNGTTGSGGTPWPGSSFFEAAGFRRIRTLGAGGMGQVFLVEAIRASRWWDVGESLALKAIHPDKLRGPGAFQRFLREGEIGRRIAHPNVVRMRCLDAVGAPVDLVHFLVMDFVDGPTLHAELAAHGPMPEDSLWRIATELALALQAVHATGVVHRDVKPSNVALTGDHGVMLMDLGISHLLAAEDRITASNEFLGTYQYASPEQFISDEVGPASDLYSVGVLLYECSTGLQPFQGHDYWTFMRQHMEVSPPPLVLAGAQVSREFENLVASLLEKDPRHRPASAGDLHALCVSRGRSATIALTGTERAAADAVSSSALLPALAGREAELRAAVEAVARGLAGDGCAVLIEGEQGSGRTRLLDECVRHVAEVSPDVLILRATGSETGARGGIGLVAQALMERFGAAGLSMVLRTALPSSPALVQVFEAAVGTRRSMAPLPGVGGNLLHVAIRQIMRALATREPVVLAIDDAHTAGDDDLALLSDIAKDAPGTRLAIILASRTGGGADARHALAGGPRLVHVVLGPLGGPAAEKILYEALVDIPVPPGLVADLACRGGGNAMFLLALAAEARRLAEAGSPLASDTLRLPPSIPEAFRRRLARLDEEDRRILDAGALLGDQFDADLVARVLGTTRLAVLQRLTRLHRQEGSVEPHGMLFRFVPRHVREVLESDVPPALAAELHGLLAQALLARSGTPGAAAGHGADMVAACHHLLDAGMRHEALRHVRRALDHLEGSWQHAAAARLALRAADGAPSDEEVELRLDIARLMEHLGRRAEQRAAAMRAQELAEILDRPELQARAMLLVGRHSLQVGSLSDADDSLSSARRIAAVAGESRTELGALSSLGALALRRGDTDVARATLEEALALARRIGDRHQEAVVLGSLGLVEQHVGRLGEARGLLELSRERAEAIGDRRTWLSSTGNLAVVAMASGRFADVRRLAGEHLAAAREIGFRQAESTSLQNIGNVEISVGEVASARAHFEEARNTAREIRSTRAEGVALVNLSEVADHEGDTATAVLHAQAAIDLGRSTSDVILETRGHLQLATVSCVAGSAAVAEGALRSADRLLGANAPPDLQMRAWFCRGELHRRDAAFDEAALAFAAALEIARSMPSLPDVARAACSLGLAHQAMGRLDLAIPLLDEADAIVTATGLVDPGPLPSAWLAALGARDLPDADRLGGPPHRIKMELLRVPHGPGPTTTGA